VGFFFRFTIRHPWVAAFGCGLLHGFGFASGLSTVGMPKAEIPLALLTAAAVVPIRALGARVAVWVADSWVGGVNMLMLGWLAEDTT
jgi:hypothetical protein